MSGHRSPTLGTGALLLAVLCAVTATAQEQDVLGIYFDPDGTVNEVAVPQGTTVPAYLCLLNASAGSGVAGWECAITYTEGFVVLYWDIQGGGINIGTLPDFFVGLPVPLPWSPSIVLMQMTVWTPIEGLCEFYLHPTSLPSLPGSMVYAPGNDIGNLIPLNWPTGGEEFPVAMLTSTFIPPACSVEPTLLEFGEVVLGETAVGSFTIINTGGGILSGDVPSYCNGFQAVSGDGPFELGHQQSRQVTVHFTPLAPGEFSCTFDLGTELCEPVVCTGVGVPPPPPICYVDPSELDFGAIHPGELEYRAFTIRNLGGQPFSGEVPATCPPYFEVSMGAGSYTLEPGELQSVTVRFAPQEVGDFSCTLDLGSELCEPVLLFGSAVPEPPQCTICPATLDFGEVLVGDYLELLFTITNTGGDILTGEVADGCGPFQVTEGAGPFALPADAALDVRVRFEPPAVGPYSCYLTIAGSCVDVLCEGSGIAEPPSCTVNPDHLNFCGTHPGLTDEQSFFIHNTGTSPFSGVVAESCTAFDLASGGGAFTLAPGEQWEVVVSFSPPGQGLYSCTITTGLPECGVVSCLGLGSLLPLLSDAVSVVIDEADAMSHPTLPVGEPLSAHLVLNYPSDRSGIAWWECRLAWNGPLTVLSWDVQGRGVNHLDPPAFAVQLTRPLPWQETLVLADFVVYLTAPDPCELYVLPVTDPLIPDRTVWRPAGDSTLLIPMNWLSGGLDQPVMIINPEIAAGVADGDIPPAAATAVLYPVYPNPFNPLTNIRFELRQAGWVRLIIYDVAGRRVRLLADEILPAAVHERLWNGLDDSGRPVPSGAYYAHLEASGGSAMQKMLLLK